MLDLTETELPPAKVELFHRLLAGSSAPIYVLGRNKYAQRVSEAATVTAFVDDHTPDRVYLGRPVVRMADLPGDAIVVSCVVNARPVTALARLQAAGQRRVIDYCALARLAPQLFAPVDYCASSRTDIQENATRYRWVYDRLADEESKRHFAKVLRFRLNMDVEIMQGFSLAIDRQYFEEFLPLSAGAVFVDGGGYDGATTRQFIARNGAYRRIYYFEPAPGMMAESRRNLAGLRDIEFVQKGLFNQKSRLRFDASGQDASRLSPDGGTEIEVVPLDLEVEEPVTFLKLDVEGAEPEAIQGAAGHIRADTPQMAVCIYHDQRDFWRIPQQVLAINDRYRLYVRHYTEGVLETVMYFVPTGT